MRTVFTVRYEGACSFLNFHVLLTWLQLHYCCCRLYKEGSRGGQLCTGCECGDRIGCGIRFDQLPEGPGDPFSMTVSVYFVRNGKEVSTEHLKHEICQNDT
jgi:hypothetical protein